MPRGFFGGEVDGSGRALVQTLCSGLGVCLAICFLPEGSLPCASSSQKTSSHGQREGPHQHRGYRSCRLWEVDDDRAPDLQAGWYRQACDREVREGGGGDEQEVVQVRVGAGQAEGGAGAWYHDRHRSVEVRDDEVLLHGDRRARASRLHQEHDHGHLPGGLRRPDHRLHHGWFRGRNLQGRADPRARAAGLHPGGEADDLLLQQDGRDDPQVLEGEVRRDREGGVVVSEEGGVQPGQDPVRAHLGVRGGQHDREVDEPGLVQGADPAGGAGPDLGAEAALGQAPAAAAAGRVQDRRHRHGAGGAGGDGRAEARHGGDLRADGADDRGEVGGDAPRGAAGGPPRRQRGVQREERGREGPEAGLRGVQLQGRPGQGGGQLHLAGDHHEPPGADRQRVRPRPRLPHLPHRRQVRRAAHQDRPPLRQGAREGAQVPEERRRRHGQDDPHQAHGRRDLLRVPPPRPLRRPRHAPDRRRRRHQVRREEGPLRRQGHQVRRQEEVSAPSPPSPLVVVCCCCCCCCC